MIRLAAVLAIMATSLSANEIACAPRDKLAAMLTEKYGETSTGQYLAYDGKSVIETFTKQNGTWTMVAVLPDGTACPVAAGGSWIATGIPQGEPG